MRLIRTELEHVCQYRKLEHVWDPGLNGILGPNGSGKSNLLKAIRFAFTGQFDNAGTKAENVCQLAPEKSRARIVQEFEHDGTRVEVVRVLRRGTSHCRVDGGEQVDGDTEVTRTVLDVLGIDQRVLAQYVFVPQRQISAFIDETPGERAKTFQQLFGLGGAATAHKLLGDEIKRVNPPARSPEIDPLRERIAASRGTRERLEQHLAACRVTLQAIPEARVRRLVTAAEQHDRDREELARLRDRQPAAGATVRVRLQDRQAAEAELAELKQARDEGKGDAEIARDAVVRWQAHAACRARKARLLARRQSLLAEVRTHPEPVAPPGYPPIEDLGERIDAAAHQVATMRDFLEHFGDRPETCPTCGTRTDTLRDRAAEYERELPNWEADLFRLRTERRACDDYNRAAAAWLEWRRGYERRLAELEQDEAATRDEGEAPELDRAAAAALVDAYKVLEEAIEEVAAAAGRAGVAHAQAQAQYDSLMDQIHSRSRALRSKPDDAAVAEARRQLDQVDLLRRSIAGDEGELRALDRQLADDAALLGRLEAAEARAETDRLWVYHLTQVQEKLHPRQIPQLVAENYLEVLADDTNDILEESDAEFRVRLGEGLGFVANFIVGAYAGTVSPAQRLSEGQKVILALPFRVAVNSLFAGSVGLLCLDEPTESLDARNITCLEIAVARLRALSESRGLQVLLVTHEPSLDRLFDGVLRL